MKLRKFFLQNLFLTIILSFIIVFPVEGSEDKKTSNENKCVYITFDDGPTYITNKLLDVLKEKNVKATFFVVGKEIEGREDILKRIYDEGHSIGLHTYSHNFRKVYKSEDDFINEMIRTSDKVKEVTGFTSNIIRFPGGSSKHLNESFLNKLHSNNYKIYDWNANLYDGDYPNLSVYRFTENSKRFKGSSSEVIILMHCNSNNKNTLKALPIIIDYYKNSGYKILPITENTKEYYYRY